MTILQIVVTQFGAQRTAGICRGMLIYCSASHTKDAPKVVGLAHKVACLLCCGCVVVLLAKVVVVVVCLFVCFVLFVCLFVLFCFVFFFSRGGFRSWVLVFCLCCLLFVVCCLWQAVDTAPCEGVSNSDILFFSHF